MRGALVLVAALAGVGCDACRRTPKPDDGAGNATGKARAVAAAEIGDAATTDAGKRSNTLLGGERGLDHVGIAVKSLDEATRTYHELLGFDKPTEGKLPNGIRNVNYYFGDATYLETMVHYDRQKAAWLADFTDKREGALFGVLAAYSPEATAQYLKARGITMGEIYSGTIQTSGESAMPEERWKTFFLPEGQLAGNPLYFIAYPRASREDFLRKLGHRKVREIFRHPNTALGLRAVWIGVPDLAAASKQYEAIGLTRGRTFRDAELGADGQVFQAGLGEIWLLSPSAPEGASKIGAFLRERGGAAILGVTLAAGDVATASSLIQERTKTPMPTYEGVLGTSIRVPPQLTHGVWLEFAQQPGKPW